MSNTPSKWVDYSTGLCIALFVVTQSVLAIALLSGGTNWAHLVGAWSVPIALPVLFAIAGMHLPRTLFGSKSTFFDRKVLRFVYFYLVWMVLQTVALHIIGAGPQGSGLLESLALGLVQPVAGLWILPLLAVFGLVTWLVRLLKPSRILLIAALLQFAHAAGLVQTGALLVDGFAQYFVFFFAGYQGAGLMRQFATRLHKRTSDVSSAIAIWAAINTTLVIQGTATLPVISLILGLAGTVSLIALGVLLAQSERLQVLQHMGRNHLMIYTGYFVPLALAQGFLSASSFAPEPGLTSLAIAIAGITGPLALYGLLRSTPLKVLYRRPKRFRLKGADAPRGQLIGQSYDTAEEV